MIGNLLKRIRSANAPARDRRSRATSLLAYLDEFGTLVLDKAGLAMIGMNRKQAFQTVYDLVLAEKIQMRAEADGRVVAMSNNAFTSLMEERARETWRQEALIELLPTCADPDRLTAEYNEDNPDFLTGERQSLPERGRDPWLNIGNVAFGNE